MSPTNPSEPATLKEVERLVRLSEYLLITGESKTQAYEKIAAGIAPRPIKDGRASLFVLSEVQAYVLRKIATAQRKA